MEKEQSIDLARLRSTSLLLSSVVIVVGAAVLIGWVLNIPVLTSLSPQLVSMKVNTALSFILIGIATLLLHNKKESRNYILGKGCAMIVFCIALLTLSQYLFGWNAAIDEIVLQDTSSLLTKYPGRMSPITAILFICTTAALLLVDTTHQKLSQALLILTRSLAFVAVCGYLFDVESLYTVQPYTSIALHTALLFLIASDAIFLLRPQQGIMRILIVQLAGSVALRRLLPAIIVLPLAFGWFSWKGYESGIYQASFGFSLMVVGMMLSFFGITVLIAQSLNRTDKTKQFAQQQVIELNRSLEKKVEERTRELEKMNTTKTEFLSLAAHQLRTPITAMKWYAEMIGSEEIGLLNTKQKQYVEQIRLGNRRQAELVNALLNISRIELGTFIIEYATTDVGQIMDSVISENSVQIAGSQLSIKKEYGSYPLVHTDASWLHIVFQNVLANAIAYSSVQSEISIMLVSKDDSIEIAISDKGHGIPADLQDQVFEKFFRADASRKKRPEGSGLGLYLSKSIMTKLGGMISFHSTEAVGTTFIVSLPI